MASVELIEEVPFNQPLPEGVTLPVKDRPILLAALASKATHLITGDLRHFGPYMGKCIGEIEILRPATYFKRRAGS